MPLRRRQQAGFGVSGSFDRPGRGGRQFPVAARCGLSQNVYISAIWTFRSPCEPVISPKRALDAFRFGVLNCGVFVRLKNSALTKVVVTNTLPIPTEHQFDKLEVLSVAKLISDAIGAVFEDTSVSEIFGGENLA